MITLEQFKKIFPACPKARVDEYFKNLVLAMEKFEINTKLRIAAFLAQVAHESYQFKYMEEIWGPTEQQKKYEPPSTLATKLGNTEKGDGFKYRGRSPLQLTGCSNYKQAGKYFGVDFVKSPEKVATAEWAFMISGWFWETRKLNALADKGEFKEITRKVNGGYTHLEDREKHYKKCLEVL